MSTDFRWETGEREVGWGDDGAASKKRLPDNGDRRYFWLLWIIVGLVLIGVMIFSRQQIQIVETAVSEQVLNSHRLIHLANARRDPELFRVVLSGRDQAWGDEMANLIAAGSFFERLAFGLRSMPEETELPDLSLSDESLSTDDVKIVLSPDLTSAEVSWLVPYQVEDETVTLRQTMVYRLGRRGWLLSPPDLDFWKGWDVIPGRRVTMAYPVRDQEIAQRLAIDLEELLDEVCRTLIDLRCPEDLHLRLRLETESNSQIASGNTKFSIRRGLQLQLPTPTMVGLPLDEAGYQALFRGYGTHLVSAVITELTAYNCCQHGPFFQALLEMQLVLLGLRPWPLTRIQYEQFAFDQNSLHDAGRYWEDEYQEDQVIDVGLAYALVDFLFSENQETLPAMMRALSPSATMDFWDWLRLATGGEYVTNQELERSWLQFLNQKAAVTQTALFPNQDLQLACPATPGANATLYRYRLDKELIEKEIELAQSDVFMVGLPDDEGVVVGAQQLVDGATITRLLLWQGETETILLRSMDDILPVSFEEALEGNELIVLNRRLRQYGLLSPDRCQSEGDCNIDVYHGLSIWSPDGNKGVSLVVMGNYGYEDRFARPFVLGSITGDILDIGKAPFWLDGGTIAFIESLDQTVRMVNVNENLTSYELFSVADLVLSLSGGEENAQMRLEYAAIDPNRPDSILVVAAVANSTYFFRYLLPTGEATFEAEVDFQVEPQLLYNYAFSPDGRWLVISGSDLAKGTSTINLYDTGQKVMRSYQFAAVYDLPLHWQLDWSADGQWLSVPDNGHLRLIAPVDDFQMLIVPDAVCSGIVWVNQK